MKSNNDILVSVHMVTYNHEDYINQAIENILIQKTNFKYELVIGEDKSTDKTLEICLAFQQKFPDKIKVVARETNWGSINNFIDIFSHCSGKYIAFCEGDDYWIDEYKLQKQVDYFEANSTCSLIYTLAKDYFTETNTFINTTEEDPADIDFVYLLRKGWFIRTSTIIVRNEIDLEPWRDVKYSFDFLIQYLCALKGSLHKIDSFTSVYRRHLGGITNSSIDVRITRMIWYNGLLKRIDKFSSFKYSNEISKAIKRNTSEAFLLALRFFKPKFFYLAFLSDIMFVVKDIVQRFFKLKK